VYPGSHPQSASVAHPPDEELLDEDELLDDEEPLDDDELLLDESLDEDDDEDDDEDELLLDEDELLLDEDELLLDEDELLLDEDELLDDPQQQSCPEPRYPPSMMIAPSLSTSVISRHFYIKSTTLFRRTPDCR
jgi:hypothetical protein